MSNFILKLTGYSFLRIASFVFLVSCHSVSPDSQNSVEYAVSDEIGFELREQQRLPPVHPRFIRYREKKAVSYIDFSNREIVLEFLESDKTKRLDIEYYKYQYVQNYRFLSNDTLLLAFNTVYLGGNHQKSVLLVDTLKNIIDSFQINERSVQVKGDRRNRDSLMYSDFTYFPLLYDKAKGFTYVPFAKYNSNYLEENQKSVAYIPLVKAYRYENNEKSLSIEVFDIWSDRYYADDVEYLRGCSFNERIVFGFGHLSDFFIWSETSNSLERKEINSSIAPSPLLGKDSVLKSSFDYSSHSWSAIYADSFNNRLLRLVRLPVNRAGTPLEKHYPRYALITFNEDLEIIEEGILPFGLGNKVLINESGYWFYNELESENKSKIIFSKLKRVKSGDIKEEEYDSGRDSNVKNYVDLLSKKARSLSNVLFIPLDNSCMACLNGLGNHLEKNKSLFKSDKFVLIIMSSSREAAKAYLRSYGLLNQSNIMIDSDSQYKRYLEPWLNIRLVQFDNDKVSFDKVFNPQDIPNLYRRMADFE